MLTSYFWDDLLQYIEARQVIPIVGHGLLSVEHNGRKILFQELISEKLAEAYAIPRSDLPPVLTLNDTVCCILERGKKSVGPSIYSRIKSIVEQLRVPVPDSLKKLAQIRHFNLFITTTFDQLLEQALNHERYADNAKTLVIPYAPNDVKDLPLEDLSERTTVFHLMGLISPSPCYAVTDEDTLEFVCALQAESTRPKILFDVLKSSNLLILGSDFPDWLARFFIRTTKSMKLSYKRDCIEYVVDNTIPRDTNLVHFLSHFSENTEIFSEVGPVEFVDRLHEKWLERNPDQNLGNRGQESSVSEISEMPDEAIFISYASEDFEAARLIKEVLERAGFDVWFDKERLGAGDAFHNKIQKNVRCCSFFLPLISHNTVSRREAYFRREWNYAIDRLLERDESLPFILPIVIDETPEYCEGVPDEFKKFQWTRLPQGRPTDEFVSHLTDMYRTAQKAGRGYR